MTQTLYVCESKKLDTFSCAVALQNLTSFFHDRT